MVLHAAARARDLGAVRYGSPFSGQTYSGWLQSHGAAMPL